MKGNCQELANHPEKIKIKFLRYVEQESLAIYEIDVYELCKAITQYPKSQKIFLKEIGDRIERKNKYSENDTYKCFLLYIRGKNMARNFNDTQYLNWFRKIQSALLKENINCQFIRKYSSANIESCVNEIGNAENYGHDAVQATREDIIRLCKIFVDSNFYHGNGRIWADYTPVVDIIEKVMNQYETDSEKKKKLNIIIEEIRLMVKSYDFPNISIKWFQWNPNLKYYDVVFQIHCENFEYYEKIANGDLLPIKFNFVPTEEDFRNEREYKNQITKSGKNEEEQYQEELIKAVEEIFKELQ